jgi:hypothetical protein
MGCSAPTPVFQVEGRAHDAGPSLSGWRIAWHHTASLKLKSDVVFFYSPFCR